MIIISVFTGRFLSLLPNKKSFLSCPYGNTFCHSLFFTFFSNLGQTYILSFWYLPPDRPPSHYFLRPRGYFLRLKSRGIRKMHMLNNTCSQKITFLKIKSRLIMNRQWGVTYSDSYLRIPLIGWNYNIQTGENISANESTWIITDHMNYNMVYT